MREFSSDSADRERSRKEAALEQALAHVRDLLRGLQYGSVTIVVQDGVVVQTEKTVKRRFASAKRSSDDSKESARF